MAVWLETSTLHLFIRENWIKIDHNHSVLHLHVYTAVLTLKMFHCNKTLSGVSEHDDIVLSAFCPAVLSSPSDCFFFFCIFLRMTMRVARAPQAAVSQTAPRLWPSPAAFSRLPLVTRTCHQVSDGPGARKPLPPPRLENGNKGRNYLCGGGSRHGVRLRLVPFTIQENVLYLALKKATEAKIYWYKLYELAVVVRVRILGL